MTRALSLRRLARAGLFLALATPIGLLALGLNAIVAYQATHVLARLMLLAFRAMALLLT